MKTPSAVLLSLLSAVTPGASGCGGGPAGSGPQPVSTAASAATPPAAASSPGAVLRPLSSIRLSGAAASSVAMANEWLWVTHWESSVLSQVDPRLGLEAAVLEVGPWAASVTAVEGRLWIGHYTTRPQDSRVTAVDAATGVVALTAPVPHLCCEAAGARGKVWVIDPRGTLLALDPVTGAVVGSTAVALAPDVHMGLVGDEGALWISSDTTPLQKVDPATGGVVATIDVGGGIPMTIAHGLVWGAGPSHLWAVDPASGGVRLSLPLTNTIETLSLAVSDDAIWAGVRRPGYLGRVLRIQLETGQVVGEAEVGLPARILYAFGEVFVVDWDTNSLLRFGS